MGFGFVAREESIFVVAQRGGPARARPLALDLPEDRALVRERLARRTPVSERSGVTGNAAALELLDLALWPHGPSLAYLPELDAIVVYTLRERFLDLYDVIAERPLALAELTSQLGQAIETVVIYFTPDRLMPAQPLIEPTTLDDVLMTRGRWPLAGPFAFPPLARC